MESELEETNATPGNEGASTLDRIERFLAAEDDQSPEPKQPEKEATDQPAEEKEVEPDNGGEEQDAGPQLSTSDLAKYLGIDENLLDLDEDGTVKLKTKVDGVEGAAKLAEVLKSYQLEGHVNKRSMELAEREKAMHARAQQVEQQFAQELENTKRLQQFALAELTNEFQSIDWNTLDQQDPGAAARLWQKYQARMGSIQGNLQQIAQREQQTSQVMSHRQAEALQAEAQRIPTLIPEWKDQDVAAKESQELVEWALKFGHSQETIKRLNMSSAVDIATFRKAMLFDKLQQSKAVVENKVRTAPKLVKPGQTQPTDGKSQNVRNLRTQLKASGGKQGIEELLLASGKV
jgi:hypothetical protein